MLMEATLGKLLIKTINNYLCRRLRLGKEVLQNMYCDSKEEHARLAQSVERETLNLKVVGSTPTSGYTF